MKTTFAVLKEEDVKALKSLISGTEKRTLTREFVLREIRKDLKESNAELAKTIDANWRRFCELQALEMPHVVYNGHSTPVLVDWVKDPEGKFKLEKAIKAYRYVGDTEQTKVEGCFDGRIIRKQEVALKEIVIYASGFEKEVASLDKEGNPRVEVMDVTLVPKEKNTWGFTATMVDAFIAATDDLLEELGKQTYDDELTDEFVVCSNVLGAVLGYQRCNKKGEGVGKIYTEEEYQAYKANIAK